MAQKFINVFLDIGQISLKFQKFSDSNASVDTSLANKIQILSPHAHIHRSCSTIFRFIFDESVISVILSEIIVSIDSFFFSREYVVSNLQLV